MDFGSDLQTEHERYLTEDHFKRPVIVFDYPKEIKAFYMRLNDDGKTVGAMDVLGPCIGELIGGSAREERLDVLEGRIQELGSVCGGVLVVFGSAAFRQRASCRVRNGIRAFAHAGYRGCQYQRPQAPFPRTPRCLEF